MNSYVDIKSISTSEVQDKLRFVGDINKKLW
jgi:hypothetical protein